MPGAARCAAPLDACSAGGAAVLVDGRVAEDGLPADLLERDAAFAALFGDEVGVA